MSCRRSLRRAPLLRLAGLTGAGKTEALHALAAHGRQTLDLEGLASHRGSAFGGIGLPVQPSHARFAELVREAVLAADASRVLWAEDEGPFIGAVGLPPWLQESLAEAPVVELVVDDAERIDRLEALYVRADPSALEAALRRTERRLGPALARDASALVQRGDVRAAIELVLPYFDAAYRHRVASGPPRRRLAVVHSTEELLALHD